MIRPFLAHAVLVLGLWFVLGWATETRAAPEEAVTFAVVIKGGHILPPRLEVPAGRKIRLTVRNEGPGPSEFENLSLRVEKVLAPGASSFLVIHPLQPGSYRFIDEFHPDTSEMLLIAR
ncbi:cupredoxin domain-containing protein [Denitratisoma oestradiolicum]|uniref:Iron transporter n=1 Tax=Denitratisoma oestradiolicum TaxID=311182 RepID=A0A6S6YAL3_9PROT|nr:cupredoxin domain-containing protein [Denitratisoma oestradiolicum]TWO79890.1 iron transporter [Denitratisoma oestradiolicum]CAB1369642.1 Iron transporter [Denitratisoma oestradiolicum]